VNHFFNAGKSDMTTNQSLDNLIKESCSRCFPVELWSQEKHGTLKYSGNLLPVVDDGEHLRVRASVRLPDDSLIPPSEGTRVLAFFLDAEGIYSFESVVLGWKPSHDTPKHGMVNLAYPTEIHLAQRRNFFRVPMPTDSNTNVDLKVRIQNETFAMKGKVRDISGGGMAIRTVKAPVNYLEPGTRIQISFELPSWQKEIALSAGVVRLVQEEGHYCYGVKFVDHFRNVESRSAVNAILQYIASMEKVLRGG